jgi:predicted esterase
MIRKSLTVPKTARYFCSAEPSAAVREVVFVCHGYAQLASEFINEFNIIANENRLVVAPEGLHRFYHKGGADRVVASWMTKEDREDDIRDYISWLDMAAADILLSCRADVKVTVLGFSQGAATVTRWITAGMTHIDHLILWCGFFPPDIREDFSIADTQLTVVTASEDRFITEEETQRQLTNIKARHATYKHIRFEGHHVIDAGTLSELFNADIDKSH